MIGNIIRKLRIKEKKEISQVANLLGVKEQTYIDWEEGLLSLESDELRKVADFYHEDIRVFFKQDCLVSLHDQRCTRIEVNDEGIRFFFPKGIYLVAEYPNSNLNRSYKTKEASVFVYYNSRSFEPVQIRLFELDHRGEKVVCELQLDDLASLINEEGKQLEVIAEYKSYWTTLFEGCLWAEQPPYHTDCQIYIDADRIDYCWDELSNIE